VPREGEWEMREGRREGGKEEARGKTHEREGGKADLETH